MTCGCFTGGAITKGKECCDIRELAIMPLMHLRQIANRMTEEEWAVLKPKIVARRKLIREEREIKMALNREVPTLKGSDDGQV